MRPDMHKVVIERPRYGHGDKYHNYRARNERGAGFGAKSRPDESDGNDHLPSKQGMRRPHNTRYFSDHLGPLKRFLRSRVDRRWDEVYSEIRAGLSTGSTTHQHILSHVAHFVSTRVERRADGLFYDIRDPSPFKHGPVDGLYVDPDTGILRWAGDTRSWRRRPEWTEQPEFRRIDGRPYRRINGCWFEGVERELPPLTIIRERDEEGRPKLDQYNRPLMRKVGGEAFDVLLGRVVRRGDFLGWRRRGGSDDAQVRRTHYCEQKRQLSSKELRRLGLVNDDA
jgi:hypothetical protein